MTATARPQQPLPRPAPWLITTRTQLLHTSSQLALRQPRPSTPLPAATSALAASLDALDAASEVPGLHNVITLNVGRCVGDGSSKYVVEALTSRAIFGDWTTKFMHEVVQRVTTAAAG